MHRLDVCGPFAEIGRVDRGDPAREYVAVRPDELDAVARPEAAVRSGDADGEQARAPRRRRARARRRRRGSAPATRLPWRSQSLNAGRRLGRREARPARAARERLGEDPGRRRRRRSPSGCRRRRRARRRRSCSPCRRGRARCPARSRRCAPKRRPRQHPFAQHAGHRGEQHEQPRAHEHRHLRGERVVVAEADLVGRRRVVLVHDRHAPSAKSAASALRTFTYARRSAISALVSRICAASSPCGPSASCHARCSAACPSADAACRRGRLVGRRAQARAVAGRARSRRTRRRTPACPSSTIAAISAARSRSSVRRGRPRSSTTRLEPSLTTSGALHRCCVPSPTTRYWRS